MIGRAAQGNPWIFGEIRHFLDTGEQLPPPSALEILDVMQRHISQLHLSYGEYRGVRVARKHISWYLKNREDSTDTRKRLMRTDSAAEQFAILNTYFRQGPRIPLQNNHHEFRATQIFHNPHTRPGAGSD